MEDKYLNFMRDFCFYLLEELDENKNYETEFENGRHHQLWVTLNHIKNQSVFFDLDQEKLGIENYDPDKLSTGNMK